MTLRCRDEAPARAGSRLALVWLGVAAWSLPAAAHVGHPPERSPYRDIRAGAGPVLQAGYMAGGRGTADVGLTDVWTAGLRYDASLGGPTRLTIGASVGRGDRFIVDPTQDTATRKSGPVQDDVFFLDAELQLLLTGPKTWRGLAPYLSGALGLAYGGTEPAADTSAYRFGTKFVIVPGAGVRWYPAARLSVHADARLVFWRLRYPSEFYLPPEGGASPPVLTIGDPNSEWTRHPWLRFGVGWTF